MERVQIRLRGGLQLLSVRKSCKSALMRTFALHGRPTRNIREGVAFLRYTVAVRESAEEPIFGVLLDIVICAFHQH